MKKIIVTAAIFVLALSYFGFRWRQAATRSDTLPPRTSPDKGFFIVPCKGEEDLRKIKFHGQVTLDVLFMDRKPSKEVQLREAVQTQLTYLLGYLNFDEEVNTNERLALSSDKKLLRISKPRKVAYGTEIIVDNVQGGDYWAYTKKAIERGATHASDPAWTVEYDAQVSVASCVRDRSHLLKEVRLPRDPYLAFWYIAPEKRRPINFFSDARTVTNPCADNEIADIPLPFYYWYVWSPRAKAMDGAGQSYDCRELLVENTHYLVIPVESEPVVQEPEAESYTWAKALNRRPEIAATMIFGPLQVDKIPFNSRQALEEIEGALDNRPSWWRRFLDLSKRQNAQPPIDAGLAGTVEFIKGLHGILDLGKIEKESDEQSVRFVIPGWLKGSGKPLTIKLFYGLTDASGKNKAAHWPYLMDGLENDDIVFYNSHAGMGANMSMEKLASALKLPKADLRKSLQARRYQFVGIFSCYAYNHFGQDFMQLRHGSEAHGIHTDLLLWASRTYRPWIALEIFNYLDSLFQGKDLSLYNALLKGLNSSDFVVLQSARSL